MKQLILVNGVPASGKSSVARAIADAGPWPLLTLDTIKESFFAHLGTGDRDYNRLLGKASYQSMFSLAADFPDDMTVVMDAWFGFQPEEVLAAHIARVGEPQILQVWCHAPPDVIGERYCERVGKRSGGHLGLDYVPELVALAQLAQPLQHFATYKVDTTRAFDVSGFQRWIATC